MINAIWLGVALSLTVYGISIFGDAVRDLVDPRLRGGAGRFSRARKKLRRGGVVQQRIEINGLHKKLHVAFLLFRNSIILILQ